MEINNPKRIVPFQKGFQIFVKTVLANFHSYHFYTKPPSITSLPPPSPTIISQEEASANASTMTSSTITTATNDTTTTSTSDVVHHDSFGESQSSPSVPLASPVQSQQNNYQQQQTQTITAKPNETQHSPVQRPRSGFPPPQPDDGIQKRLSMQTTTSSTTSSATTSGLEAAQVLLLQPHPSPGEAPSRIDASMRHESRSHTRSHRRRRNSSAFTSSSLSPLGSSASLASSLSTSALSSSFIHQQPTEGMLVHVQFAPSHADPLLLPMIYYFDDGLSVVPGITCTSCS